jgi:hypothetical protein
MPKHNTVGMRQAKNISSMNMMTPSPIHFKKIVSVYFKSINSNILFSVLLLILSCNLGAQTTTSPIEKFLLSKQKSMSPDQLFVHLDRNKYKPGDTIYFQAYIRDNFTNDFESKSISLYALLLNNNNAKVDSSRFRINNSTCSGWMTIPLKSKTGKYHFVAFTSIMQNFDPSEAFRTDLFVNGADKITVENITSFDPEFIELKFLPEGGNSVQGLEQRIGFIATDVNGYPVNIEGLLKNKSGLTLDSIKSGAYGPGSFVCTTEPDMYVEITKGNSKEKIWKLPNPIDSGICLSVKPIDNRSFSIEIQSNYYKNDTIFVVGVMNTSEIFLQNLVMDKKQRMVIETNQLPSGVAQITIFSKDLHPLAERLYYLNSDKHLMFNIVPQSQISSPGQENELAISVTDGLGNPSSGFFSISVTDSISGIAEIYTPGIESVLNFNPYFHKNLPKKVLVTGLENLSNTERDLMLMIYGWSRYNWDFTEKTTPEDLFNYDLIDIKVKGESKFLPSVKLDLISLEDPTVFHLNTNKMGDTSMRLDSLPENSKSIIFLTGKIFRSGINGVNWSIPYNEQFLKNISNFTSQQSMNFGSNTNITLINKPATNDKNNESVLNNPGITDKIFEIPEVTISASKKIEYINKYEELYKYANVKSMPGKQINNYLTLGQAIRNIAPAAIINEPPLQPAIYFRQSHSFFGARIPAMIVLDGMPVYDGWAEVRFLPTDQIASISILEGAQGHIIYGEEASGGVIFINTNKSSFANIRTDWKRQNISKNLLTPINIFRKNVEFYNPMRSEIEDTLSLSDRPTVYWNPEVYFDGRAPVKIKYRNLKNIGTVLITINGASINNLIGTGKASCQVK